MNIEVLYDCWPEGGVRLFAWGHHERRAFVGAVLSQLEGLRFQTSPELEAREVVTAEVRRGYWGEFSESDGEWCEPGWVVHETDVQGVEWPPVAGGQRLAVEGTVREVTWLRLGGVGEG